MKKKLYVSIPITGFPIEKVKKDAQLIKDKLSQQYDVITPFDVCQDTDKRYSYYMGEDIKVLLECDVIYMAHGWKSSRGCCLELYAAGLYGKDIIGCELPEASCNNYGNNNNAHDFQDRAAIEKKGPSPYAMIFNQ
jgi:hypothetical protein